MDTLELIEAKIESFIESILLKPYITVNDYLVLTHELDRLRAKGDSDKAEEILNAMSEQEVY